MAVGTGDVVEFLTALRRLQEAVDRLGSGEENVMVGLVLKSDYDRSLLVHHLRTHTNLVGGEEGLLTRLKASQVLGIDLVTEGQVIHAP